MPTIPLYNPNSADDAWHQVIAPGGYEWWYFDAEDVENDRQIVAIFLEGFIFHPGYLRKYARYQKRPTRFPPPLPRDFTCAYFVVYQSGKIAHQFMTQYPSDCMTALIDRPSFQIGPNRFSVERQALKLGLSGIPWILTARGPLLLEDRTLQGTFSFEPQLLVPPHRRVFISKDLDGGEHHWIVANPLCQVRGTIHCGGETIEFNGRGYHDHNFGTGPLGPGLKRWLWGRVLLDDAAYTFHVAQPKARNMPDEVHLLCANAEGVQSIPVMNMKADWTRKSGWQLRYPESARFDEVLVLSQPRLIDSSPFYLRLQYDARVDGRSSKAFCEIAYPHRLRWPVLGRMIEMSIDKRPVRASVSAITGVVR